MQNSTIASKLRRGGGSHGKCTTPERFSSKHLARQSQKHTTFFRAFSKFIAFSVFRPCKGFSLSEVLITLGIIGIVAAMTLPALVSNYQKKQNITRLKKTYSQLQETLSMSVAKYGDINGWDWTLDTSEFFEKYIGYNFKYTKNCKSSSGCWNKDGSLQLNGIQYDDNPNKSYWVKLKINDGTMMALQKQDNTHVHIDVDINGNDRPNMIGKDIFMLTMSCEKMKDGGHNFDRPGLYFYGHGFTRDKLINLPIYGCSSDKAGLTCGELLLMDGWEIKNDYPW